MSVDRGADPRVFTTMSSSRLWTVVIGALGVAVISAGCGGGGSSKAAAKTTPKPSASAKPSPKPSVPGDPSEPGDPSDPIADPMPSASPSPGGPTPEPPAPGPATVKARVDAADAFLKKGQYSQAESDARAALAIDETHVPAMAVLANVYYAQGKYERAEFVIERATEMSKTQPPPQLVTARLARLRGLTMLKSSPPKTDDAIVSFREATELDGNDASSWHNLGTLLVEKKLWNEAASALERAVQIQPRFARAHVSLGAAYRGQSLAHVGEEGRPQREALYVRAKGEFEEALKIAPNLSVAQFNLGILYLDADSFPGMDTLTRLATAIKHLSQYQSAEGAKLPKDSPVVAYIEEARKNTEKENKRLEREKKKKEKEEEKARKAAEKAAKGGAAPAPADGDQ